MSHPESAVITGAFSYTGRYVSQRLLGEGVSVRTLTRSTGRESPFGGLVKAYPLDFSDPDGLRRSMEGAGVLYNTYWIRFGRGRPPSTRRWKTQSCCLTPPPMRALRGSFTSPLPMPPQSPDCPTFGARGRWRRY